MSNWKEYTLGDISRNISRRFDFNAYPNVVFINTGDVLNNKFLHCDISNVKDLPGQAKKAIKKGDILYSEIRPGNGRYLFVDNDLDNYVVSTKFMVIEPNANIVLPEFLFLLLISNETTEYFKMIAESRSGTFPQITFDSVSSLSLNIPDKETQQKILDIIIPLDGKIEINTQINQTLEQISQALFKSWFVDFDPVRAKVQALSDGMSFEQAELAAMQAISGKTPEELTALSQTQPDRYAELAETAKAFPCEMVEVDGVEVPKGWTFQYLKNICNIVYGKGLPKTKLTNTGYRVFGANGVIGYYSEFMYKNPQILIGCRGTVGQVTVSTPFSFITNNSLIIEYENSLINRYYLEHYLRTLNLKEISSGSVQLQITIQNMSGVKLLTPNRETLSLYEINVKDIYETMYQNQIENEKLTKVRDLLLPKLLSGEI